MTAQVSSRPPRDDLVQMRHDRGLSRRQAAEAIGVSIRVVTNAERGHRPHPHNRKAIAEFYGFTPSGLFPVDGEVDEEEAA